MESRGKITPLRIIGLLTLSVVLALGVFQGCMYATHSLAFSADFSKHPPEQAFQMATGYPPPHSVSELRVSGRHYFTKRWVWMRFRVTDEALRSLIGDRVPFLGPDARQKMTQVMSAHPRYNRTDQRLIGWHEIARISKPEVYEFSNMPEEAEDYTQGGWIWMGFLVVDRKNGLVYFHAWGD